jgi:hypothetical protein
MYDVSTLYVNRETFHLAGVSSKFNQTRSRSLLCPSFSRLDDDREANQIEKQHVKRRNIFRNLTIFYGGKNGIPHFPRIHTMLAGFSGLAKRRARFSEHRCTMYLRLTFTVKKYKYRLLSVFELSNEGHKKTSRFLT